MTTKPTRTNIKPLEGDAKKLHVYTLPMRPGCEHTIVVVDGLVVEAEVTPTAPPGYEDQFGA